MLTTYYVFLALGAVVLLITLFGGDAELDLGTPELDVDIDIDVDPDAGNVDEVSVFSMRTMAAAIMSFGIGGLIMLYNGYGVMGQVIVGIISGLGVGTLTYQLTKWLYSFQATSNVSLTSMIGKTGIITIGTTDTGKAQVKIDTSMGPREYLCKEVNNKKLTISDSVKIASQVGSLLMVEK